LPKIEKHIQSYGGDGNNHIVGTLKVKKQNGNIYAVSDDEKSFGTIVIKKDEKVKEDTTNNQSESQSKSEQQKEKDNTPTTNTTTNNTINGEKDETPKTGTTNIIGYALATTILSGIAIVAVKKNLK